MNTKNGLHISVEEICKKGYRVIIEADGYTEIQGIHYNTRLIVLRYTTNGIFGKRYCGGEYTTQAEKKVMKSVWQKWEEIPQTSELTLIRGGQK